MSVQNFNMFGRIGKAFSAFGNHGEFKLGKNHDLVTAHGKGRLAEGVDLGQIFTATVAVAGVDPGTALSTTPPFSLWNANGSGVKVSILKVRAGYVSGTLGAGMLVLAQVTDALEPATGTVITPVAGEIGSSAIGSSKARSGATSDGTPTILRPTGIVFGKTLATSVISYAPWVDDVDGEFQLQEGETFVVEGVADSNTSALIIIGVTYQEIPAS